MVKMKAVYLGEGKTECVHESGTALRTDIPKDIGGEGKQFSPTDLFAASVGTCMLTLMGITAKKMGFDFKGATAEIEKIMGEGPPRRVAKVIIRIRFSRVPPPQLQEKLEQAALQCPVHLSVHLDVKQEVDFIWGL